ncbi:uncharacterized protein ACA1_102100, partial [Acanthamoeba castellanii str. Neff]
RAGTQTAEAEQYQAQGRAARRLLALADLMDRASPVWRRLAQAALASYFLTLTPAVASLRPPAATPQVIYLLRQLHPCSRPSH